MRSLCPRQLSRFFGIIRVRELHARDLLLLGVVINLHELRCRKILCIVGRHAVVKLRELPAGKFTANCWVVQLCKLHCRVVHGRHRLRRVVVHQVCRRVLSGSDRGYELRQLHRWHVRTHHRLDGRIELRGLRPRHFPGERRGVKLLAVRGRLVPIDPGLNCVHCLRGRDLPDNGRRVELGELLELRYWDLPASVGGDGVP